MQTKGINAWHDIYPGDRNSDLVKGIIEIPMGSKAKYEIDKTSGLIKLDRVLHSSVSYPTNYGFIPQTLCGDGDPLDILLISQISIVPLCIVSARVIGVMRMIDGGKTDDKIIAVALNDPSVNHLQDIDELSEHFIAELRNFFENYTKLENKIVLVNQFLNKENALKILSENFDAYQLAFKNQEI